MSTRTIKTAQSRAGLRVLFVFLVSAIGISLASCSSKSASKFDQRDYSVEALAGPKYEALVQTCMKRKGFNYIPGPVVSGQIIRPPWAGMSERDREAQFGTTTAWTVLYPSSPPDLSADPMNAILSKMPPGERASFQQALGDVSLILSDGFSYRPAEGAQKPGCRQSAARMIDKEFPQLKQNDAQRKLTAQAELQAQGDREIAKLNRVWERCSLESGYPAKFRDPNGATVLLSAVLQKAQNDPSEVNKQAAIKLDIAIAKAWRVCTTAQAESRDAVLKKHLG